MDRRVRCVIALFVTLAILAFAPTGVGAAAKPSRIGILLPGDAWSSAVEGLKEGLKGLGYVEGRDVVYALENAQGDKKRVAEITEQFLVARVDLIFTITNTTLKIVADLTKDSRVPVVFGSASGPVESGIRSGYAVADTNITGVTSGSIELVAKRLEILKEVLPHVRRVTVIGDRDSDSSKAAFAVAEETAPKLGLTLTEIKVTTREGALEAARKVTPKDADALFLVPSLYAVGSATEIAAAARANRVPLAVYQIEHVKKHGALLGYGSSYYLQGKQSAVLVDKILKGTLPSRLPIERPKFHHLVLNLDTANAIGVRLSPEMLNRADELIGALRGR